MADLCRPPDRRPMPQRGFAARQQLLMNVVRTDTARRHRALRWAVPGVTAAVVLSGGVAAAAYVNSRPATVHVEVTCYTEPSVSGFHTDAVELTGQGSLADIAGTAVDRCADLWRLGIVGPGPANAQPRPDPQDAKQAKPNTAHPVPALTACTRSDGVAAVFPGMPGTCALLGLPELAPG